MVTVLRIEDIPADLADDAELAREMLMEAISEVDDSIMERFLEGEDISEADIKAAIRKGTLDRAFVPVLCGSAFKNKGVQPLLDACVLTFLLL